MSALLRHFYSRWNSHRVNCHGKEMSNFTFCFHLHYGYNGNNFLQKINVIASFLLILWIFTLPKCCMFVINIFSILIDFLYIISSCFWVAIFSCKYPRAFCFPPSHIFYYLQMLIFKSLLVNQIRNNKALYGNFLWNAFSTITYVSHEVKKFINLFNKNTFFPIGYE